MSTSELEARVARFGQNESRVDKWVNGGPTETYTSSGGVKVPTIQNINSQVAYMPLQFDIKLLAKADKAYVDATFAAYVGGRKAYTTLALAQADQVNLPANTAVEVTNDGVNNGTYQWNGTTLTKSNYDPLTQAKQYSTEKINTVINTASKNIDDYAFVVADENNNVGLGIMPDASVDVGGVTLTPTGRQTKLAWGIADDVGNVPLGTLSDGGVLIAGQKHEQANVSAIVDQEGNATNVIKDGDLYQKVIYSEQIYVDTIHQKITSCYEENGNIFMVYGGEVTQITTDGLNKNPVFASDRIVFLSNKQRGVYKQYQYKDGVISRYYPSSVLSQFTHIVITGQSLAEAAANGSIDRHIVDNAYRIGGANVVGTGGANLTGAIAPLQEVAYETVATGFATQLEELGILLSGCASGGKTYANLKKGGSTGVFENCISQVELVHDVDKNSYVPALFVIHGEADGNNSNTVYDQNLRQWLDDFNSDVRVKLGHSSAVMLTCQTSSASGYKTLANRDQFTTPFLQLKASNNNPDIFLVCPKYQYAYKDYAHILAADTRHLGEMYAKVYRKVCIDGEDWKPLQPTNFVVSGNQIVVDFHVPVAPLQFDTSIITTVANQGFELTNSGAVTITDVQITSATQVTITCSANVPNNAVLSYAFYNGTTASTSGRFAGSRGTLKDSDNTPDKYGYMNLNNWCVIFKQTLTV